MGFTAITTHHLPAISNWTQADKHFNSVKPWRDADPNVRPLGTRREKHKVIVRIGDAYALRLHATNVVSYHANGTVEINTGGWNTQSTIAFARRMAPQGVHVERHRGMTYLYAGTSNLGRGHFRSRTGHWRLTRDLCAPWYGKWVILNPQDMARDHQEIVDRRASVKVRAQVKGFEDWVQALLALSDGDLSGVVDDVGVVGVVAALDDDPDVYPNLLKRYTHRYYTFDIWGGSGLRSKTTLPKDWKRRFRADLYQRAECMQLIPIPVGELPPNRAKVVYEGRS